MRRAPARVQTGAAAGPSRAERGRALQHRGKEDDLIGSAGEFGLLFAFEAHRPDARKVDGEPTLKLANVKSMFVDHKLPDGWEHWKKTSFDWVADTTRLMLSAGKSYLET